MKKLSYRHCVECIDAIFKHAAQDKGLPVGVSITDAHGDLVAFGRMDGAPMRTVPLSRNKAFSAVYMDRDTNVFRDMMSQFGFDLTWFVHPQLTALPGGVRVLDGNTCLGAIGLSGRSADQDHELAAIGVEFLKKRLAA
jgi:uncharacterized protein GlcG (DUF336 family)